MPTTTERRSAPRRKQDRELLQMSQSAKDTAEMALAEIRQHVAVCEQQNIEVIKSLKAQDEVLEVIRRAISWIKNGRQAILALVAVVAGIESLSRGFEWLLGHFH